MARNLDKTHKHELDQADDDLGSLIRWSLKDSLARETPPDDLWLKIRARIESGASCDGLALVGRKRRSLSLAPLIQAVVASSLVLAFVLGADRSASSHPETRGSRATTEQTVVLGSVRPRDIPRIHIASISNPKQVVRQRIGGATE